MPHHPILTVFLGKESSGIETYYYYKSEEGKKLAKRVNQKLVNDTKMKNRGIKPNKKWTMLKNTLAIAILPELGFYDNPDDYKRIITEEYSKTCAKAIVRGLCEYLGMSYGSGPYGETDKQGVILSSIVPLVKEFQRNHDLAVDGIIGPLTWGALINYQEEWVKIITWCEKIREDITEMVGEE